MGLSQVRKAYLTGTGTITVRGKCEVKELPNGKNAIIITEIPFQVNKNTFNGENCRDCEVKNY